MPWQFFSFSFHICYLLTMLLWQTSLMQMNSRTLRQDPMQTNGYTRWMKLYRRLTWSRGNLPANAQWIKTFTLCTWLIQVDCISSSCMVEWSSTVLFTPVYARWKGTTNIFRSTCTPKLLNRTQKRWVIHTVMYIIYIGKFTSSTGAGIIQCSFCHYQALVMKLSF